MGFLCCQLLFHLEMSGAGRDELLCSGEDLEVVNLHELDHLSQVLT